jgi:Zn finger protein HypA/HybF involved in hydrogenase expression
MKQGYSKEQPLVSGESVTPGKFKCVECGYEHEVKEGVVNLPVCPRCQGDAWRLS